MAWYVLRCSSGKEIALQEIFLLVAYWGVAFRRELSGIYHRCDGTLSVQDIS